MSVKRAQLSLQIEDEELYNQFILPYKEQKALHGVIIKCLSAYYYNEEVRNMIEGTSLQDVTGGEDIPSAQSICDSIRTSLMMQDYLATELQHTIDMGTEDVSSILNKTNSFAKNSGVASPTKSEYGSGILQIEANNQKIDNKNESQSRTGEDTDMKAICSILLRAVGKLAEASGNSEVIQILNESSTNESNDEVKVHENFESLSSEHEVPSVSEDVEEIIEHQNFEDGSKDVSNISLDNDVTEDESDEDTSEEVVEDATDALLSLFGSLND